MLPSPTFSAVTRMFVLIEVPSLPSAGVEQGGVRRY